MPRSRRGVAGSRRRRHGPSRIRVLVVDDYRAYASALVLVLETDDVIEVVGIGHDGREAISLATKVDPDVILLDLDMPHVDGIEAAREISSSSGAEILMLSAVDSTRAKRIAHRAGASEFLHKAIDPFALIGYVHEAAHRHRHRVDAQHA
jgi:DNA-binding NarL/FixJ family response regulator